MSNTYQKNLKKHFQKWRKEYSVVGTTIGAVLTRNMVKDYMDKNEELKPRTIYYNLDSLINDLHKDKSIKGQGYNIDSLEDFPMLKGKGLKAHFKKHKKTYGKILGALATAGIGAYIGRNGMVEVDDVKHGTNRHYSYDLSKNDLGLGDVEPRLRGKRTSLLAQKKPIHYDLATMGEGLRPLNQYLQNVRHKEMSGEGFLGDLWEGVKPLLHGAIKYFSPHFNPRDSSGNKYLI